MKHIVSFSGGKDSTAMLLRMLEENMPIDKIIFVDTGKDFPDMLEHIKQVQNYIVHNYEKEIITLMPRNSFDYYMFEHKKLKEKTKEKEAMVGQQCFVDGVQVI